MATVALGATYSPPSPLDLHYPDTISSIHPDRPIRPLPKRRLRSRVSSEVAESILYTPDASSEPLFQFPYHDPSKRPNGATTDFSHGDMRSLEGSDATGNDSYQFKGNDSCSDSEAVAIRVHQDQRQRSGGVLTSTQRNGQPLTWNDPSKYIKPPITQSIASSNDSVDGYDSFENTNNKKKRKIPTSGSLGNHHSALSAEMANMGLASARELDVVQVEADSGVGHYYGSGSSAVPAVSSGNGLSGAGRGRYGRTVARHHSGRSPLGVSVNGSNTLQANRSLYHRSGYGPSVSGGLREPTAAQKTDQGIISAAIANAAALPTTPARGKENTSLFEQQPSKKSSSAKTQFTFTCESDSAKSMAWPEQNPLSHWDRDTTADSKGRNNRGFATQGTQTSPNITNQPGQNAVHHPGTNQQVSQQPKKPRRPLAKQYAIAARDRRLRQEYSNFHHPPKVEDTWMCQFCEYESIFGQPPQHLIRQYEAKDRRERKRAAEKRRLLEKAKMKGRKNKKGNKTSKNSNAAAQQQQQNQKQQHNQQSMDEMSTQDQGTQSEEYVMDDYDDEPIQPPALPYYQTPTKIPQPVSQNHHHSLRPPSGSGAVRQGQIQGAGRETYV